jgi:hypothetical protein
MQTFYDHQQRVLQWLDESESTGSGDAGITRTNVKAALNASYSRLMGSRTWPWAQWPREESFTTSAGVRTYALKHGVGKILTLYSSTDPGATVPLIGRREWESLGVDRVFQQSVPMGFIYGDVWPVSSQPTSAAVAVVTSSTDADAALTVVLTGLDSNGDYASETLTLADVGSTASATSTTSWLRILSVTKTGTWTGTLTLSVSSVTLLTLTASQYGKQYPTLEAIETPSVARTYLYTAQRTARILTLDYDIPDTPYPHSEYHVYDALLDMATYNTELSAKHINLWQQRRKELWDGLIDSAEEAIAGARPRFVRSMSTRIDPRISLNV